MAFERPDVLVLAAGGVLGEAWMSGLLAGVEEAAGLDMREVEALVGTSAGSIVASRLASGNRPRRPRGPDPGYAADAPDDPPGARPRPPLGGLAREAARFGFLAAAPFVPGALALGAPAGGRVRAALLARVPEGRSRLDHLHREVDGWGARFDGRLRVCCVDTGSGRRVVFGSPGAPEASVADAVLASCAIPSVFRPVDIGGRRYVDGGAWSLTNLDAAPAGRDSRVLCLNPSGSLGLHMGSVWGAARAALGTAAAVETLALRRRGADVELVSPSPEAARLMGTNFMDVRPAERVHAAGYRQGMALAA